jgi:hypothetical protein
VEERTYRILLVILVGLVLLNLATIGFGLFREAGGENPAGVFVALRFIGYGLLPVAAAGLWFWRTWGFWLLGLSTLLTLAADLPEGLFAAFWRSFPHLTTIALTVEQYLTRKEAKEAKQAEEASKVEKLHKH